MKIKQAIEIGYDLGLIDIEDCINNIIIHAPSVFPHSVIEKELDELINEAKLIGIEFCTKCELAIKNGVCDKCELFELASTK